MTTSNIVEKVRNGNIVSAKDFYNLDTLFTQMKTNNSDINRPINNVPFFKDIALSYEKLLTSSFCENYSNMVKNISTHKCFEKNINILDGSIYLIFDIYKISKMLQTNEFKSNKMSIEDLLYFSQNNHIDSVGLKNAQTNYEKPILLHLPFISGQYIVIDGTHRIAYNNSIGKKSMDVYILSLEDISNCHISLFNKVLLSTVYNIYLYFSYINDFISLNELNASLIPLISEKY